MRKSDSRVCAPNLFLYGHSSINNNLGGKQLFLPTPFPSLLHPSFPFIKKFLGFLKQRDYIFYLQFLCSHSFLNPLQSGIYPTVQLKLFHQNNQWPSWLEIQWDFLSSHHLSWINSEQAGNSRCLEEPSSLAARLQPRPSLQVTVARLASWLQFHERPQPRTTKPCCLWTCDPKKLWNNNCLLFYTTKFWDNLLLRKR